MQTNRFATIRISTLNGGAGTAVRNVSVDEFEAIWRRFIRNGDVPSRGVGAFGDGIINIQWTIYEELPTNKPDLHLRLLGHKIQKAINREKQG